MSKLAKTLSVEEQINIAVYFSQRTAKARPSPDTALIEAGESLFKTRCEVVTGKMLRGFGVCLGWLGSLRSIWGLHLGGLGR
ncbi:hypothetical protein [Marinobacter sp.]|uniref:hypothetical protein n=1 Tax=Marinobacter sp. TaxID=50741 RepID=UPI002B278FED|nr:hypothetical protein [Marinobacter sp.]